MPESQYAYAQNAKWWHLFFAAAILIGGSVSLIRVWGYLQALEGQQGELVISSSSLTGPLLLLLWPIPLMLEWIRRTRGWQIRERKHLLMIVIPVFVLLAGAHNVVQHYYPPYVESKGWDICRSFNVNSGNSSRHYEVWRPKGQCRQ